MVFPITPRGLGDDDNDVIIDGDDYDDDYEGVNGVYWTSETARVPQGWDGELFIAISGTQPCSSENKKIFSGALEFQGQRSNVQPSWG